MAEQQKKEFREVGERRKYIDDVNADRRSLWTELSKLPQKHPELPANFADGFFRRDIPADDGVEEVTVESVQQEIEDHELPSRRGTLDFYTNGWSARLHACHDLCHSRCAGTSGTHYPG